MNSLVVDAESNLRLVVFVVLFTALSLAEIAFPRRTLLFPRTVRWRTNIAISVFNTLIVRIAVPLAGVGAALFAQQEQWGIFPVIRNYFQLPQWASIIIFLFIFDLTIYYQHRVFHAVPFLWRFHRVHHTDMDYDITTGIRFHPVSIIISSYIKILLIMFMGVSAMAVVIAEILLNATSMFNHSNLKLAPKLESFLRLFLVTPDMHRIHHSSNAVEHNHNFGFNFPWWDRLFNTYIDKPEKSLEEINIGIEGINKKDSMSLFSLLSQPFRRAE
ncbi:MAG: sterol desaturase [SAR86 cluster bacterium]|uniref:Sterol desaturase n=1 Tax=SAR86 cluster bacterium TaxID=2030880 RepID=A0A2A5B1Y8_9GAMM|nr:MAG: sterol desaturase [SAR86 cluster bacterium]